MANGPPPKMDLRPPPVEGLGTAPFGLLQGRSRASHDVSKSHTVSSMPGRITLDAKWYIGQELVGYGRKPADYDQPAFQGIHARYVLVIIDEAGGVPKSIFDAVDVLATNIDARVVAVGNLTILHRTSPRSVSPAQAGR